jgi:hypothetical protein
MKSESGKTTKCGKKNQKVWRPLRRFSQGARQAGLADSAGADNGDEVVIAQESPEKQRREPVLPKISASRQGNTFTSGSGVAAGWATAPPTIIGLFYCENATQPTGNEFIATLMMRFLSKSTRSVQ